MTRKARSVAQVLRIFRERQDELDISNASLEELIGVTTGYYSKVTAARPVKSLSAAMFQNILDGLALGIVAIVIEEDAELTRRMRRRWTKRKRPPTTASRSGASLSDAFVSIDNKANNGDADVRQTAFVFPPPVG
jgi:hypothetical protein